MTLLLATLPSVLVTFLLVTGRLTVLLVSALPFVLLTRLLPLLLSLVLAGLISRLLLLTVAFLLFFLLLLDHRNDRVGKLEHFVFSGAIGHLEHQGIQSRQHALWKACIGDLDRTGRKCSYRFLAKHFMAQAIHHVPLQNCRLRFGPI